MTHTSHSRRETPDWFSQGPHAAGPCTPISFVTPDIAISGIDQAASFELLREAGIRSIVSLVRYFEDHIPEISGAKMGREVVPYFISPDGLIHPKLAESGIEVIKEIPLRESARNRTEAILEAIEAIESCRSSHAPVLVHCLVGAGRAPGLVAAYLASRENISFKEGIERIARTRRVALAPDYAWRLIEALHIPLQ